MSIKVTAGELSVNITTKEDAIEVIASMCFLGQYNHRQMKEDENLQRMCEYFSIDSDNIIIYNNPHFSQVSEGFPNIYQVRASLE